MEGIKLKDLQEGAGTQQETPRVLASLVLFLNIKPRPLITHIAPEFTDGCSLGEIHQPQVWSAVLPWPRSDDDCLFYCSKSEPFFQFFFLHRRDLQK